MRVSHLHVVFRSSKLIAWVRVTDWPILLHIMFEAFWLHRLIITILILSSNHSFCSSVENWKRIPQLWYISSTSSFLCLSLNHAVGLNIMIFFFKFTTPHCSTNSMVGICIIRSCFPCKYISQVLVSAEVYFGMSPCQWSQNNKYLNSRRMPTTACWVTIVNTYSNDTLAAGR